MSIFELFNPDNTPLPDPSEKPTEYEVSIRTKERAYLREIEDATRPGTKAQDFQWAPIRKWCVYFLYAPRCGRVKVGTSQNAKARFSTIAQNASEQLHFLGWIPGGLAVERSIHTRLAQSRRYGEWFDLTPEVAAELARFGIPDPVLL